CNPLPEAGRYFRSERNPPFSRRPRFQPTGRFVVSSVGLPAPWLKCRWEVPPSDGIRSSQPPPVKDGRQSDLAAASWRFGKAQSEARPARLARLARAAGGSQACNTWSAVRVGPRIRRAVLLPRKPKDF